MFDSWTRRSKRLVLFGVVLAAFLAIGGYAYPAITSSSNRIYTGCLKGGLITSVRIGSSPRAACSKSAMQITWNQTGPSGPRGLTGPSGPGGPSGPSGPSGPRGLSGSGALSGSGCTFDGFTGTVQVSVNDTSGAISLVCVPPYIVG